jgi:integrase
MATLYKPRVSTYKLDGKIRLPDGSRVTKDTPGAVREVGESPCWWGRWRDARGKHQQKRLSPSKETARRMLAKLAGDASLGSVGISDRYADHRAKSLADHLDDFRRALAARDNCPEHVARTVARASAVLQGVGVECYDDLEHLDGSAVEEHLAALRSGPAARELPPGLPRLTLAEVAGVLGVTPDSVRRLENRGGLTGEGRGEKRTYAREDVQALLAARSRGVGAETSNHYLQSVKALTRWMVRNRRLPTDPLSHLSALNTDTDRRHERRAAAPGDFGRFLDAAAAGVPFRGLDGTARVVLYCVAVRTGLRASELASLTPGSLDLAARVPTATVEAAYSKHRRRDVQPLPADALELLRRYAAGRPADLPLWPGTWNVAAAEMVRRDLAAAGLPYRDDRGKVLDFHGLRHTFITQMVGAGLHPKVAQVLARHSTITLTMDRYAHLSAVDVAADLAKLPPLGGPVQDGCKTDKGNAAS